MPHPFRFWKGWENNRQQRKDRLLQLFQNTSFSRRTRASVEGTGFSPYIIRPNVQALPWREGLLRQLRTIPTATQRTNQLNARSKLPALQIRLSTLILNQRTLRRQHLKIAGNAALVARLRDIERPLRRIHSTMLRLLFLLQNPQIRQLVFNLVKARNTAPL